MALPVNGLVSCLGFPASRLGRYRAILGEIEPIEDTDGWLNLRPANVDEKADLGGMSGAPIWQKHIKGIFGMLSGQWHDDELIFRIIPGKTLIKAVAQVKARGADGVAAGKLCREDAKDSAASVILAEWRATAGRPSEVPTPDDVRAICGKLLEEARRFDNQLPETFPYRHRYIEKRFGLLHKLAAREWPPQVEKLGEFVADMADFLAELALLPWDTRPPAKACDAAGRTLAALLSENGPSTPFCPRYGG